MIPTLTPVPRTADGPRPQRSADERAVGGSARACQATALRAGTARGPSDVFEPVDCLASLDARDAALAWEQARYWRNFGLGTLIGALIWAVSQCLFC